MNCPVGPGLKYLAYLTFDISFALFWHTLLYVKLQVQDKVQVELSFTPVLILTESSDLHYVKGSEEGSGKVREESRKGQVWREGSGGLTGGLRGG